jgi:tRNA (mo5U34)-methyltransferase
VAKRPLGQEVLGLARYLATIATPEGRPPRRPGDLRLKRWYHTIELAPGLVTDGVYDHRPVIDRYGLPESLAGKRALDVGTCDGFWAFELERRGAEVVALDVERWGDFDWLPAARSSLRWRARIRTGARFRLARAKLQSRVQRLECNVYDLSPATAGVFDLVFCSDVLVHLRDPLSALVQIRSVTRETAIVATLAERAIEERFPDQPWVGFGHREVELAEGLRLGESCVYWRFTSRALRDALEYAGFARTDALPPFRLPGGPEITAVVAHAD